MTAFLLFMAKFNIYNMITNIDQFRKIQESFIDQVKTRLDKSAKFCFAKGEPGAIYDFIDSLNDEVKVWVKQIDPNTIKIFNSDPELYTDLLNLAVSEFDLDIEQAIHLNRREININEGFGDKISPARMQKKVDEVNALIAAAKDTDGDPIGVIDTSGTWQAEMKYKPVIYKNGFVFIEYDEQGEKLPKKERFKPSDSYDAYQTLSQIATLYRRVIKKNTPATSTSENVTIANEFVAKYNELDENAQASFANGLITIYLDNDPNKSISICNALLKNYTGKLQKIKTEYDTLKIKVL